MTTNDKKTTSFLQRKFTGKMSRIVTLYCSELTTVNPSICFLRTVANLLAQLSLKDFKEIILLTKESKKKLYSRRITKIEDGAWLPWGLNILQHPSRNPKVWEVLYLIPLCFFVYPKPQCILLYIKVNSHISGKWSKRNESETNTTIAFRLNHLLMWWLTPKVIG